MSKRKKGALLKAVQGAGHGPAAFSVVPEKSGGSQDGRAHRRGKVNITGYFDPSFRKRLHLVQARRPVGTTVEQLLGEAMELLFAKESIVGGG